MCCCCCCCCCCCYTVILFRDQIFQREYKFLVFQENCGMYTGTCIWKEYFVCVPRDRDMRKRVFIFKCVGKNPFCFCKHDEIPQKSKVTFPCFVRAQTPVLSFRHGLWGPEKAFRFPLLFKMDTAMILLNIFFFQMFMYLCLI